MKDPSVYREYRAQLTILNNMYDRDDRMHRRIERQLQMVKDLYHQHLRETGSMNYDNDEPPSVEQSTP